MMPPADSDNEDAEHRRDNNISGHTGPAVQFAFCPDHGQVALPAAQVSDKDIMTVDNKKHCSSSLSRTPVAKHFV